MRYSRNIHLLRNILVCEGLFGDRIAADAKMNIFVNRQGLPHKNIPCDQFVEHINRVFKVSNCTLNLCLCNILTYYIYYIDTDNYQRDKL